MRRLLIVFIALILAAPAWGGPNTFWYGKKKAAAGGGYTNFINDADIVGAWYMEEATTSNRADATTNGNALTPNATMARSTTKIQGTYSVLNVRGDYTNLSRLDNVLSPATFPGKSSTGTQTAVTVGGWVNIQEHVTGTPISKGYADDGIAYRLLYNATDNTFALDVSSTGFNISATVVGGTAVSDNTWYFVAGVYDGSNIHIYRGTQAGAVSEDASQVGWSGNLFRGTTEFVICADRSNGNNRVGAYFDEMFVFKRALSISELESIRAHGLTGTDR